MRDPLVSIIVPCYNMEQYVKTAVKSLLENNYSNKEIILIDDGSTDSTLTILFELSAMCDCIKVITKRNGGVASARNLGLDLARGDYIMFVDPDDWVMPDFIEKATQAIIEKDCDVCLFAFQNERGQTWIPKHYELNTTQQILDKFFPLIYGMSLNSVFDWVHKCSTKNIRQGAQVWKYIFRKRLLDNNGIRFPLIRSGEDTIFLSECLLHAHSFRSINNVLYTYVVRDNGLWMTNLKATDPNLTLQDKIDAIYNRRCLSVVYKELTGKNARHLYAGSCIMSCFQLGYLFSRSKGGYFNYRTYIGLPEVQQCINDYKEKFSKNTFCRFNSRSVEGGKSPIILKRFIPLWLLYHGHYKVLFSLFYIANKLRLKLM